jgi:hypothetical protein
MTLSKIFADLVFVTFMTSTLSPQVGVADLRETEVIVG